MTAADWYRRALGRDDPAPPARPSGPNLPPTGPPGLPASGTPWQPVTVPGTGPSQPTHYQPGLPPQSPAPAGSAPTNMTEAITHMNQHGWRGGDGTKNEVFTCPRCNSRLFFTKRNGQGVMGNPPAPRCQECGYNGLWEQFGDRSVE